MYGEAKQELGGRVTSRTTDAPAQPSQVRLAQSNLNSCFTTMHEVISALEDRLHPVLSPMVEKGPEPTNKAIRPVASTVSQEIAESAETVCQFTARLQRLLDRLEV